jgi:hypothetical protein
MTRTVSAGRVNPHWLLWPLVIVLGGAFGGYKVGKDLALRDNAREAAALERVGTGQ